jgi:type II secretion system protein N
MLSAKTLFAYLAYALLAAVVFLYLLFPDQAVKAYMDGRLAAIDPGLSMQADSIRPAIPPGLKMTGVDLIRDRFRLARFDHARMYPQFTSLLKAEKAFRFQARLADGDITGRAVVIDNGPTTLMRAEAELSSIRLEQLTAVGSLKRFTLGGLLDGRLTHEGDGRAPAGTTNGDLSVSQLRITLKTPILGIADLLMDQTDAAFSFDGRSLRLKALTFDGPMLEGKINGSIALRRPLGSSRLNLSGNARPRPELIARLQQTAAAGVADSQIAGSRGMTFRVRGTIDKPELSMR